MSNPDSFIDEVREEVRKDRLYRMLRRYGWIGALVVLVIVGGTAYREWSTTNKRIAAEAVGDSILAADALSSPSEQIEMLDGIAVGSADAGAIRDFIVAATMLEDGDRTNAIARLAVISSDSEVSTVYRDLAMLKSIAIRQDTDEPGSLVQELDGLIEGDSEFRFLALEIKAIALERMGRVEDAVAILRNLRSESGVPRDLSNRAAGLLAELEADS